MILVIEKLKNDNIEQKQKQIALKLTIDQQNNKLDQMHSINIELTNKIKIKEVELNNLFLTYENYKEKIEKELEFLNTRLNLKLEKINTICKKH